MSSTSISSIVVVLGALVGGVALLGLAAGSAHRSSLACRRDPGRVLCELRRVYPGSIVTTDQVLGLVLLFAGLKRAARSEARMRT